MNIKKFGNYKINEEVLGIAEPTLDCVDISGARIYTEILDILNEESELNKKITTELVINYSDIKRFVEDWDKWSGFPVSEIKIDLIVTKKSLKDVKILKVGKDDEYQTVPFKMGAYASSFAKGRERMATRFKDQIKWCVDHTLSIHFGIDLDYSDLLIHSKNREKYEKELQKTLDNVLLHEINHLYEYYQRKLKGKKEMETTLTAITTGENIHRRARVPWKYWNNFFLFYIYMAEPHEIRAYTQECKSLVEELSFEEFKKHKIWLEVVNMANFDYKNFLKRFIEIISKVNPDQTDKTISLFVSDFKKDYRKTLGEYKEKGLISPGSLDKMSEQEFFEYWERKIKTGGKNLYRRILRLYSYKSTKEEIN